jgi:hypothetical protein
LVAAFDAAGVLGLAAETQEIERSLMWLVATVGEVATAVPAVAFALAAHYAGYRAVSHSAAAARQGSTMSAGVLLPPIADAGADQATNGASDIVVPTLLEPSVILGLDLVLHRAIVARRDDLSPCDEQDAYSGLDGAGLVRMTQNGPAFVDLETMPARAAIHDWNVLCSAVLLGIARSSMRASETYTAERYQFGSALRSFAAIRSTLAQMALRVESLESLVDRALDSGAGSTASFAVLAESCRVATSLALDAIQLHGGYGCMEEYAVAGHLRDAITASARSGGRRSALSNLAAGRVGAAPWDEVK